jgi:hypothetical protein
MGLEWLLMGFVAFRFGGRVFVFYGLSGFEAGYFLFFLFFDPVEGLEGAMVLAVKAVRAAAEFGVAGVIADGTHGMDGAGERWFVRGGFGSAMHFVGDGGGFEGQRAEEKPLVDAQFFDEAALGGGGGQEFGMKGPEESDELRAGFSFDEYGVGEVIEVRGVAADWGFWAGGFCRVGPVGGELLFCEWHTRTVCGRDLGLETYVYGFIVLIRCEMIRLLRLAGHDLAVAGQISGRQLMQPRGERNRCALAPDFTRRAMGFAFPGGGRETPDGDGKRKIVGD